MFNHVPSNRQKQQQGSSFHLRWASRMALQGLLVSVLILILLTTETVEGFVFVPGFSPTARLRRQPARVEANGLHSSQHNVPYPFYSKESLFCHPAMETAADASRQLSQSIGLGALLSGERPQWSGYLFSMLTPSCDRVVCDAQKPVTSQEIMRTHTLIEKGYRAHLMLDSLPVYSDDRWVNRMSCPASFAEKYHNGMRTQRGFHLGVPAACSGGGMTLLNNHLHFTIRYHALSPEEEANYDVADLTDGSKVLRMRRRRRRRAAAAGKGGQDNWKRNAQKNTFGAQMLEETGAGAGAGEKGAERREENESALDNEKRIPLPFEGDDDDDVVDNIDDQLEEFDDENEEEDKTLYIVVSAFVEPFSIDWDRVSSVNLTRCVSPSSSSRHDVDITAEELSRVTTHLSLSVLAGRRVRWTYSVRWLEEPEVHWATRWDGYFRAVGSSAAVAANTRAHYLSMAYSVAIIMMLASTVAAVIARALCRDVAQYAAVLELTKDAAEAEEEKGWRAIRGDAFRLPPAVNNLIACVASGAQLLVMFAGVMAAAQLGYCSPANRGGLLSCVVFLFFVSAVAGGFTAARLCTALGRHGDLWITIGKVALGVPGLVYGTFAFCNVLLRAVRSAGAVPSGILVMFLLMWVCVFAPLTVVGAKLANISVLQYIPRFKLRGGGSGGPKVNPIPRPLPQHNSLLQHVQLTLLISGISPLLVVIFELRLIFAALYQGVTYYFFGFLAVTFFLWFITCALISIFVVYHRLCSEDYRWWWISFMAPSSLGLHLMLFVVYFYFSVVKMTSLAATLLYIAYMSLIAVLYVLSSGAVGFFASYGFVRILFNTAKFD